MAGKLARRERDVGRYPSSGEPTSGARKPIDVFRMLSVGEPAVVMNTAPELVVTKTNPPPKVGPSGLPNMSTLWLLPTCGTSRPVTLPVVIAFDPNDGLLKPGKTGSPGNGNSPGAVAMDVAGP